MPLAITGVIAIWSGTVASIPTGWSLCDGSSGKPDLRDRFVRGAAAGHEAGTSSSVTQHYHDLSVGDGAHANHSMTDSATHTHTLTTCASHYHGFSTATYANYDAYCSAGADDGAHYHNTYAGSPTHNHLPLSTEWSSHTHAVTDTLDHRPPWYDVLFIQAAAGATIPVGLIIIWTGLISAIPTGWSLCNGSGGTPDFVTNQLFTRGASAGSGGGGTGGALTHAHASTDSTGNHAHTENNAGDHTHAVHNAVNSSHDHGSGVCADRGSLLNQEDAVSANVHSHADSDSAGAHAHTEVSDGEHTHTWTASSNLPLYKNIQYIINVSASQFPLNGVFIWTELISAIPSGTQLCDGSGSSLDLRTYFPRQAAAGVEAGGTGGAASHTHTSSSSGGHTHTHGSTGSHSHGTTDSDGDHTHGNFSSGSTGSDDPRPLDNSAGGDTHEYESGGSHTHTIGSSAAAVHSHTALAVQGGVSKPENLCPPYYEVQFVHNLNVPVVTVTKTFTAGASLHIDQTKTLTVNSSLQKNLTKALTGGASLLKSSLKTLTAGASLAGTLPKTFTAGGQLQKSMTKQLTAGSSILGQYSKVLTVGADLKLNPNVPFTVNAELLAHYAKTFTIGADTQLHISKDFTFEGDLLQEQTISFTVGADLKATFQLDVKSTPVQTVPFTIT
jgi:hypothetical protein